MFKSIKQFSFIVKVHFVSIDLAVIIIILIIDPDVYLSIYYTLNGFFFVLFCDIKLLSKKLNKQLNVFHSIKDVSILIASPCSSKVFPL